MNFNKLTQRDKTETAKLLADYWKERGLSQYGQKWAEKYLSEGHKKEILKDDFFVYKENKALIGTVSMITNCGGLAEIRDLVVKQEHRGKGYGKKIVKEIIKTAGEQKNRKLFAITFPQLEKFYISFGFEKEGLLKSHFAQGENMIIMGKQLD